MVARMTDDTLVCDNRPVTTHAGDHFPPVADGDVPLYDTAGNRIGIVRTDGDRSVALIESGGFVAGVSTLDALPSRVSIGSRGVTR